MKIDANITINRRSDDMISITVVDEKSRLRFLSIEMTPEEFTKVITGLSYVPVKAEVIGLENVGKKKITEARTALYPKVHYNREAMQKWIIDNCQEDGWLIDPYLGSQSSIGVSTSNGTPVNYKVHRFE